VPAPNITPDKATGIGSWTDQQIADAIRNGKAPDEQLFPIMPYPHFHFMSDQDTADLVAFLRTVPPVANDVPERTLNGPVPSVPPLPPAPATAPTEKLARGAYLVNAVVGCGDCHTPSTASGEPDMSKNLAGGFVPRAGGRFEVAPNITPDPATGIGTWSEQDIISLLKTGQRPGGRRPVGGLMALVIQNQPWGGLNSLTDDDAAAIAAYLKSIPAVNNVARPPTAAPPAAPAAQQPPAPASLPPAPTPAPATAPAQAPRALPRTGLPIDLATPVAALGGALTLAGLWIRRRH
jgi:mono/diheme cytochrome c family protein